MQDSAVLPIASSALLRSLQRLTSHALVELIQQWTEQNQQGLNDPLLDPTATSSQAIDKPAASLSELRQVYQSMLDNKASRREILERLVDVDWKRGLSLRQWAEVDFKVIRERSKTVRWSALSLNPVSVNYDDSYRAHSQLEQTPKLSLSAARVMSGLQEELGSTINMHITHEPQTGNEHDVLRVAVFSSDTYVDNGLILSTEEEDISVKLLWLVLPTTGNFIMVSPSSIASNLDQDNAEQMIVTTISRTLRTPNQRWKLKLIDRPPGPLDEMLNSLQPKKEEELPSIRSWAAASSLLATTG